MRIRLFLVLLGILLCAAPSALAQNPEEGEIGDTEFNESSGGGASGPAKPASVGLLLGYGISLEDGENPWGLGFGVRGGYNLDAIFLGGRFVYYIGSSVGDASLNIWELGIEGGYDVRAGSATIRPGLGLGIANSSVSAGGISFSSTDLYIAPGASVLFDVSDNIFIGGEARLKLILADGTGKAITLLANGGMRF